MVVRLEIADAIIVLIDLTRANITRSSELHLSVSGRSWENMRGVVLQSSSLISFIRAAFVYTRMPTALVINTIEVITTPYTAGNSVTGSLKLDSTPAGGVSAGMSCMSVIFKARRLRLTEGEVKVQIFRREFDRTSGQAVKK